MTKGYTDLRRGFFLNSSLNGSGFNCKAPLLASAPRASWVLSPLFPVLVLDLLTAKLDPHKVLVIDSAVGICYFYCSFQITTFCLDLFLSAVSLFLFLQFLIYVFLSFTWVYLGFISSFPKFLRQKPKPLPSNLSFLLCVLKARQFCQSMSYLIVSFTVCS